MAFLQIADRGLLHFMRHFYAILVQWLKCKGRYCLIPPRVTSEHVCCTSNEYEVSTYDILVGAFSISSLSERMEQRALETPRTDPRHKHILQTECRSIVARVPGRPGSFCRLQNCLSFVRGRWRIRANFPPPLQAVAASNGAATSDAHHVSVYASCASIRTDMYKPPLKIPWWKCQICNPAGHLESYMSQRVKRHQTRAAVSVC